MSLRYGPPRTGDVELQVTEPPLAEPDLTLGPVLVSQPRVLLMSSGHPFARRASVGDIGPGATLAGLTKRTLPQVPSPRFAVPAPQAA
ncbi:hypothetical protein QA811_16435 [Streptomyces sp. B21-102]|uniref:hypothetical protein n=1 Tax=Streptomyces sp. B21-102 TaxID=3039416 RepID=UPI002FF04467